MKKGFYFLSLWILLTSAVSSGSLLSITTSTEDALINKRYKTFILIDDETNYTLGRTPVLFDMAGEMPLNYFTETIPESLNPSERIFVIHSIVKGNNPDNYDWVLDNNPDENEIFYSRKNFVKQQFTTQWMFQVKGNRVLIKSKRDGSYIKINAEGKLVATSASDASKWKLMHIESI